MSLRSGKLPFLGSEDEFLDHKGFGGTFVADAAPRLAPDILITIDDERVVILGWRRLATRESPRTAAGPIHSCAGHRCVGL